MSRLASAVLVAALLTLAPGARADDGDDADFLFGSA